MPDPRATLWLCEGEPDCLCALSQGLRAVCTTGGAGTFRPEWAADFAGLDVVVAYDADAVGRAGGLKAAGYIAARAERVRVLVWPEYMMGAAGALPDDHGQDLTDFFVHHGKSVDDLLELLELAEDVEPPAAEPEKGQEPDRDDVWRFFDWTDGKRARFVSSWLAQEIMGDLGLCTDRETMRPFRWTGTHYTPVLLEDLQSLAIRKLEKLSDMSRVRNSVGQAMALSILPDGKVMNPRPELLCLPSGMLNLDTLESLPHKRKYRATAMLPWGFDPRAPIDCPRFKVFLVQSIGDRLVIAEVQEFFGYCLWHSCQFEKALFCIGVEGSGKGILLHILRGMLGEDNCSSVDLEELEDKFTRAGLHDKAANVFFECDARRFTTKYFNAICSGDPMRAAFKFKDEFDMRPRCKLAFSANEIPRPFHASEAYLDRVLPVRYTRKVRGTAQQDPDLKEKLLAELPGIFAWAVVGLVRLRARGMFKASPLTRAFLDQYRTDANPYAAFVDECCKVEEEEWELSSDVWRAFRNWSKACGRKEGAKETALYRISNLQGLEKKRSTVAGTRETRMWGLKLVQRDNFV